MLNQGNIFGRVHKSLGMVEEVRFSLSYIGKGGGFSVIESLKRVDAGGALRVQDRVYEESWFSISPLVAERRSTAPSSYGDGGRVFEE